MSPFREPARRESYDKRHLASWLLAPKIGSRPPRCARFGPPACRRALAHGVDGARALHRPAASACASRTRRRRVARLRAARTTPPATRSAARATRARRRTADTTTTAHAAASSKDGAPPAAPLAQPSTAHAAQRACSSTRPRNQQPSLCAARSNGRITPLLLLKRAAADSTAVSLLVAQVFPGHAAAVCAQRARRRLLRLHVQLRGRGGRLRRPRDAVWRRRAGDGPRRRLPVPPRA